jgi:threonine dehydratase
VQVEHLLAATREDERIAGLEPGDHLFSDTHNVAEGAGAAPLAAALQHREDFAGRRIGLALTGGNVDRELFARVLAAA